MRLNFLKSWVQDESGNGPMLYRLLTEYGVREKKSYALALGLLAITSAATAATAFLIGTVVNQAYVNRDMSAITMLAVVVVVVFTVKGFAMYGGHVILARISNRIVSEVQRRTFDKLLIENVGFFSSRHSTEFLHRVSRGAGSVASTLDTLITALGRDILTLIGLGAVMFIREPLLSLIGLLVMPPAILFVRNLMRRMRELSKSELAGGMKIFETLQETIRGLTVVKAFTLEQEMRERLRESIASVERRKNAMARLQNRISPVMESLGGVAIALVLLYGGYLVLVVDATPGEFVSFITAFLLAYEPAKRVARLNVTLTRNVMAVRLLFSILDSPPTEPEEPETDLIRIEKGRVRFSHVNFEYNPGEPVLRAVSFLAEAGQMTALVGPSGGGKSTVISLIMRFYDAQSGLIEIDGTDITEIPRRMMRRHIAYVGQDVFLFRGSIRENIGYGKMGATDEEVVAAARAAYAHDFIMKFPEGYDTQVGEAGLKLSAGQRQRIAVARALIRNAPIILLDEATSSLDSQSEREVQLAVERLREGRTCIAIAHRLHTITQAEAIHVLEHGQIVESGTHRDLIERNGRYAEWFRMQASSELEDDSERPLALTAAK